MKRATKTYWMLTMTVLLALFLVGCDGTQPGEEPVEEPDVEVTSVEEPEMEIVPGELPEGIAEDIPISVDPEANYACLDFEDLRLGAVYTNDDVFTTGGVEVHTRPFELANGNIVSDGYAEVQNGGLAGGSGHEFALNNINLTFIFPSQVQEFTLLFGEYGGNLNIQINGYLHVFDDFYQIHGMQLGGVDIFVPVGGFGNDRGVLKLVGPIDSVTIGGQELWIDTICDPCIDFEDLTLGEVYSVGDIFLTGGVTVYARPFLWDNGDLTFDGQAEVQNGGQAGGTGLEMAVNNINLAFVFPVPIQKYTLLFGEYGGNLNLSINGDFVNFQDFQDVNGLQLGGVTISVPAGGNGNDKGMIEFSGPIKTLIVGGQELWIDGRCEPAVGACIEFEDLTVGTSYPVGDTFPTEGILVEVRDFTWSNGVVTSDGQALVDNSGASGGSGNEINANNVNLHFDFGGALKGLTLLYGAHGGNLNIEINGDFVNFDAIIDINGATIGGVLVTVTPIGTGGLGMLTLEGEIEQFIIGGQEFWVDHVCPFYIE